MRLTIIPDDQIVIKNGNVLRFPFDLPGIHAVQWYEDHGEVEYLDGRPNEEITSLAPFQSITAAYQTEKTRLENEAIEAAKPTIPVLKTFRNQLLQKCDWTQGRDVALANDSEWLTYRQKLRDLPQYIQDNNIQLSDYATTAEFVAAVFPIRPIQSQRT